MQNIKNGYLNFNLVKNFLEFIAITIKLVCPSYSKNTIFLALLYLAAKGPVKKSLNGFSEVYGVFVNNEIVWSAESIHTKQIIAIKQVIKKQQLNKKRNVIINRINGPRGLSIPINQITIGSL